MIRIPDNEVVHGGALARKLVEDIAAEATSNFTQSCFLRNIDEAANRQTDQLHDEARLTALWYSETPEKTMATAVENVINDGLDFQTPLEDFFLAHPSQAAN